MKRFKLNDKQKRWLIGGALMVIMLATLRGGSNPVTQSEIEEIMRTSYLGTRNVRGIRNNNPLNIKYSASRSYMGKIPLDRNTDVVHEQFESLVFGIAAAVQHMTRRYINGSGWSAQNCANPPQLYRAPFKTLERIANVWAPRFCDASDTLPGGNNPDAYVRYVVALTGIDPLAEIDPTNKELMKKLIWGMALYECGGNYKANILSWENWDKMFNVAWTIQ